MNSTGRDVLIMAGMVLAVYLPKALPLLLARGEFSPAVARWLKYVAPAVLAAMVAPSIMAPAGQLTLGWSQLPFLVTLLLAIFTRRMFVAVVAGVATVVALFLLGV